MHVIHRVRLCFRHQISCLNYLLDTSNAYHNNSSYDRPLWLGYVLFISIFKYLFFFFLLLIFLNISMQTNETNDLTVEWSMSCFARK